MRALILTIVSIICTIIVSVWLLYAITLVASPARQWPAGLGTVDDVPRRYPDTKRNDTAQSLIALCDRLGFDLTPKGKRRLPVQDALRDYVTAEAERTDMTFAAPPPVVASYLTAQQATLDETRTLLLAAPPPVWETKVQLGDDMPVPNLLGHMQLSRLLLARAYARHDAEAWDDLHATWRLTRGLFQRPDLISVLIALSTARGINAAAARMPLPPPPWLDELRTLDCRRALAAAIQAETWVTSTSIERSMKPTDRVVSLPLARICLRNEAEAMRRQVIANGELTGCDIAHDVKPVALPSWNILGRIIAPDVSSSWMRAARFRAELEATDRIVALRAGGAADPHSRCSDGTWIIRGATLRFSRAIPIERGTKYRLSWQ